MNSLSSRVKHFGCGSEMKRAENELTQELNRKPTDNELADKLQIPLEKLSEIKKLIQPTVSLENSIDSESNFGS